MNYYKHPNALVSPKAQIGEHTRIWAFSNILEGAVIGKNCNICDGCFVEKGAVLGDNVTLKNNVSVFQGIILEDGVFCGASTVFINDRYPRSNRKDLWVLEKTVVKKGATLGSNVTVLCGITIGEYAFVGAGAVVTRDVSPHAIVFGNPIQFRGYACRCGKKLTDKLICSCGLRYTLQGEKLKLHE